MIRFEEKNGDLLFGARVVPRASKSEIVGERDSALELRIASPPVDGVANDELIKLLSKTFGVAKSAIRIIGGQTSKTKRIQVSNVSGDILETILQGKI